MGAVGVAAYSTLTVLVSLGWSFRRDPPTAGYAGFLTLFTVDIAALASSMYTAHRLATRPRGFLRFARMLGIILATRWFPILTVPGIICVRRATRYFAAYCNLIGVDTDKMP